MMQTLKSISLNLVIASLFYFGFVEGIEGAQNVVKFFVWAIALPIGLMTFNKAVLKEIASKPKQPKTVEFLLRSIAWLELGLLLWTGQIFTAIAFGFYMLCAVMARFQIDKYRKEAEAVSPPPEVSDLRNAQAN